MILDECHHLMGHWGRVLADARELLDEPIVVGLTATPPDRTGKPPEDVERYDEFFGPVDYEVPVPAVVKDGFLAPYQDLAYFVRPTAEELEYLATADGEFHEMVEQLVPVGHEATSATTTRLRGVADRLAGCGCLPSGELPTGKVKDWASFERRDPELARMRAAVSCRRDACELPEGVPEPPTDESRRGDAPGDRRCSCRCWTATSAIGCGARDDPADHELAEQAIARLRVLGVQITETGPRACASPVGRVMAYSPGQDRGACCRS